MAKRKSAGQASAARRPTPGKPAPAPRDDLWDRILWVSLHLLVFLVPLAMSNFGPLSKNGIPLTYDQFDMTKVFLQRGIVLVAGAAWLIGLLLRGGRIRMTRSGWLVLAFLVWVTISTVLSVHWPTALFGKYRRFEGLLSFLTYGAAWFLTMQAVDGPERMRSLARTLAVGGFVVAAYGALQVVGTVGLGAARILLPTSALLTVGVPAWLVYLSATRGANDREARVAYLTGAAIAFVSGLFFSFGLGRNIELAAQAQSDIVSLDPVLWGRLGFEANRAFSTFGNPDMLGGYLILPFAVSLGLALSEKHDLWRTIYWSFTLLAVFAGITSYTRGAWIGATVSLVVLVFAYLRAKKGGSLSLSTTDWTFIGGTILVGIVVIVASAFNPHPVLNVFDRIASIFDFSEGSGAMRLQIWNSTLQAIGERPVFGWGADTTRLLFPMFKSAEYVRIAGYLSVADNVHNYPLQLASGVGIPGALLFYGFLTWALGAGAKTALGKGTDGRSLLLAGLWAAVVGYVSNLLFGLSVTGSTIVMWVILGMLLVPGSTVRDVSAHRWAAIGVALVVVALAFGTYFNTRYVAADAAFLKGKASGQSVERLEQVSRAVALNPYNEQYQLGIGDTWRDLFLIALGQYSDSGGTDLQAREDALNLHAKAADAYRDVIEYVPLEYDTYVFLADLHNSASTIDPALVKQAEEAAREAIEVERYGPLARLQLATALLRQDRVDEAIAELELATDWDPAFRQGHVALGKAYAQVGRYDDARRVLRHILELYPGEPSATAALAAVEASAAATP